MRNEGLVFGAGEGRSTLESSWNHFDSCNVFLLFASFITSISLCISLLVFPGLAKMFSLLLPRYLSIYSCWDDGGVSTKQNALIHIPALGFVVWILDIFWYFYFQLFSDVDSRKGPCLVVATKTPWISCSHHARPLDGTVTLASHPTWMHFSFHLIVNGNKVFM